MEAGCAGQSGNSVGKRTRGPIWGNTLWGNDKIHGKPMTAIVPNRGTACVQRGSIIFQRMKNSNSKTWPPVGITRRRLFETTGAGLLAAAVPSGLAARRRAQTLKAAAREKGIRFGAAARVTALEDQAFLALLREQCNVTAAANAFKWHVMEKGLSVNFADTDKFAAFAVNNGFRQRGHAIVWDRERYSPRAIQTATSARVLGNMVAQRSFGLVSRYRGAVQSWDVVNEAVHWKTGGMEKGPLYSALGLEYAEIAFKAARDADAEAELVYNDYVRPYRTAHQEGVLRFLDEMARRGTPIDAIGIQGHLWLNETNVDYNRWSNFLREIEGRGLKILLTEFDVVDNGPVHDFVRRDMIAADYVRDFLDVTLENRAVIEVVVRSLTDKYEGLSWASPRKDGQRRRPSPFDASNQAKPMRDAMLQAFASAPARKVD